MSVCSRGRGGRLSDIFFYVCVDVSTTSVLVTWQLIQALVYGKYLLSRSFYPEGHAWSLVSPCPVGMLSVPPQPLGIEA